MTEKKPPETVLMHLASMMSCVATLPPSHDRHPYTITNVAQYTNSLAYIANDYSRTGNALGLPLYSLGLDLLSRQGNTGVIASISAYFDTHLPSSFTGVPDWLPIYPAASMRRADQLRQVTKEAMKEADLIVKGHAKVVEDPEYKNDFFQAFDENIQPIVQLMETTGYGRFQTITLKADS